MAPQGQRHDRSALILYGSETGTSQDAAEDLGRMLQRIHFATRVSEMDDVQLNDVLQYPLLICVISTTGQGEFPKNARGLWRSLLRKSLSSASLSHVAFTTFGQGDSSYAKFNWAARKLHKRLAQLGAKELYPRGEGDEQHDEGNEGTFLPWSADVGKHILLSYPLLEGETPIPPDVPLLPKHWLVLDPEQESRGIDCDGNKIEDGPNPDSNLTHNGSSGSTFHHTELLPIPNGITAKLLENKRVTPMSHWQDVRHLTFSISAIELSRYSPGDVVTIYPKNVPLDVQELIDIMEWNTVADHPLLLEGDYSRKTFCTLPHTTLRQLLTHNLDITGIPNRYFFQQMSYYTTDDMHKERLLEFCNPVYTDEFYDYTTRPRRGILEVLQDFSSVKLPWRYATSIFPPIRGRQFSIASGGHLSQSPTSGQTQVEILVAIVRYKTVLRKIREGLCSRYLAALPPNCALQISFEENAKFYDLVRREPARPVIMIAPGTGVAPCRSLIYQLLQSTHPTGPTHLFFSNRNRSADFFFHSEWSSLQSRETLDLTVHTAFSRDQQRKIYIQDIIREQAGLVRELIGDGAVVVVCGSSGAMPKAVREALIRAMVDECEIHGEGEERDGGERGDDERGRKVAEATLKAMEDGGRFIQETW